MAVQLRLAQGIELVSCFDVMTDALFNQYLARGVPDRAAMVITQADRDRRSAHLRSRWHFHDLGYTACLANAAVGSRIKLGW